jgi:4-amino-4-deoxy-L-arabinose transferase-like glycosyltransferase
MIRERILLLLILLLAAFLIFFRIHANPPGLYIDEVAIGHNAASLLTNGKDEHGAFLPIWFKSFGDYKMPVYIYSVAGAMAVVGKNEFAVRLPSALSGIASILIVYFLVKNLLVLDKTLPLAVRKYLPLLSALLLSISSWHIHFSRGGFEANMGVAFFLLGVLFFVLFVKNKKARYLLMSIMFFLVSMYTYHSFRVAAPLAVFAGLSILYWKLPKMRSNISIAFILFIIGILPIAQFSMTKEGSERFAQTSAFSEYKVDSLQEQLLVYPMVYMKNLLSFFSLNFLFTNGDGNGRHQIASFGLLYLWQGIFLLFGLYALIRGRKSYFFYVLLGLILLSVIPAALSRPSPHSLRALLLAIPLIIIISLGAIVFFTSIKRYVKLYAGILVLLAFLEFVYVAHFYSYHYSKVNLLDWGAGYRDVVIESARIKDKYEKIYIDSKLSDIKTYYDFYGGGVTYEFVPQTWVKPKELADKKVLYIRPYYGAKEDPKIIKNIIFPNVNKDIFAQFWVL